MINKKLQKYIEETIFPEYAKNDEGHNLSHIDYVIKRSIKFAKTIPDINMNMVYTIASYHDIGHHIDAKNHEVISSEILEKDLKLKEFFSTQEIKTMKDAIIDHRASLEYEPRSVYGKIVSSADRNTNIEIPLKRTYSYRKAHYPNASIEEIIEESRLHIIDKFGKKGYAKNKMYFEDEEYNKFLRDVEMFAEDKELFRKRYIEINKIEL